VSELARGAHCVVPTVWRPVDTLPDHAVVRALLYSPVRGVRQAHYVRRCPDGRVVGSLMGSVEVDVALFSHWAPAPHPAVASSRSDGPRTFAVVFVAVGMVACVGAFAVRPDSVGLFLAGMAAAAVCALVAGYASSRGA
jgi:hypothetical protein